MASLRSNPEVIELVRSQSDKAAARAVRELRAAINAAVKEVLEGAESREVKAAIKSVAAAIKSVEYPAKEAA